MDTPRPLPRTNRTRRVPYPVLIGHAASLARSAGTGEYSFLFEGTDPACAARCAADAACNFYSAGAADSCRTYASCRREVPDTDATAVTYRKGSYLFLEADETGTDAAPGTVHFASPPGVGGGPPPPPPRGGGRGRGPPGASLAPGAPPPGPVAARGPGPSRPRRSTPPPPPPFVLIGHAASLTPY